MEEPPIWISGVTTLEDEEAGLVLGAISTVKSLLKVVKMEESFEFFFLTLKELGEEEESNDDS